MAAPSTYIVESIPIGMEQFENTSEVKYTKNVLTDLINTAEETIDLTAMYWSLIPDSERPDEAGFTEENFREMGGDYGRVLFNALENAAKRGVKIRILQSFGFEENGQKQTPEEDKKKQEWTALAEYKDQVVIRQINMNDWYEGGIMHQKFWVFDNKNIYLGSANMDWRSMSQVKELGIVLENQPEVALELARYFEGWWHIASFEVPIVERVYDPTSCFFRTVPAWSPLVPKEKRIPSPLEAERLRSGYDIENPMPVMLNGQEAEIFITGSPLEFCAPGRTYDADALVHTIQESRESVCISVMDFVPISLYRGKYDRLTGKCIINGTTATGAWWPMFFDAILKAVITNGVHVRLLVSRWPYTNPMMEPFLRVLRDAASVGWTSYSTTCGFLEIRRFYVPGWHNTFGPTRLYPGHTRVNHTKYVVTDRRLNIGTSNMTWDYFSNTAGTSFNSNHPGLVKKLQEIFDRDWGSEYAYPF